MRELRSTNHSSHLILYHLIFAAKYRRKVFANKEFGEAIKSEFYNIASKYDFEIDTIDLDYSKPDHIHVLVRSVPTIAPYQIMKVLKQESNIFAWKNYSDWLKQFYWKSHHFFSRGYFVSTVGNVSADTVHEYLEKQGRNEC